MFCLFENYSKIRSFEKKINLGSAKIRSDPLIDKGIKIVE